MGHCQFLHERPGEYAALLEEYMLGHGGISKEPERNPMLP